MTDLLQHPPSWIIAIVIPILTAHAIDKLIDVVTHRRSQNALIPLLETFIVFVIGFLTLHSYYEGMFKNETPTAWYDRPFALVMALALFTLGSIGLYIVSRAELGYPSPRKRSTAKK